MHWSVATGLSTARVPEARAQSLDDLFNDTVVQEIRLTLNSRSLSDMHANWEGSDYHTGDFQWRNIRVRNIGIRVRGGFGSRNPDKLGLGSISTATRKARSSSG